MGQSMNNLRDNKYVIRLINEWRKYGKIVLAVDFDDTLFPWGFKEQEDIWDNSKVISIIKVAQEVGIYLTIWSACDPSRYDEIREWCTKEGLKVDSINENPTQLPYGLHRKMYYNHLLDDRAGLVEALEILEFAMYTIRGEQHSTNEQKVEF